MPLIESPFALTPSRFKDTGSAPINGLLLFVYVQFVRGLAPFPFIKEAIYNSIHVYLLRSQCGTFVEKKASFSQYAFTNCKIFLLMIFVNVLLMIFREGKTLFHLYLYQCIME